MPPNLHLGQELTILWRNDSARVAGVLQTLLYRSDPYPEIIDAVALAIAEKVDILLIGKIMGSKFRQKMVNGWGCLYNLFWVW